MNKVKILEAKILRGEILKILYNERPRGLKESILKRSLVGDYTNIEIEKELAYLADRRKAYIYRDDGDTSDETDAIIEISRFGIDLIEGTQAPDPGIAFREEGV